MPLIAMTREMGSLGHDVAAGIAAANGGRVVYQELIDPLADRVRLRKTHVTRFLDGREGLWEPLASERSSGAILTPEETLTFLRDGSVVVIRGWGAVHLLDGIPHVIRVRVCAPMAARVDRMMARLGTDSRQVVENEIQLSEEAHTAIVRRHFGIDWRDPGHYDVVLSTERLGVEACIATLQSTMARPCFRETAESRRMVEHLAVACSAGASLCRNAGTAAARSA
ncbi:MAG TPA: cytidylate kinase family protein [Usitatibacter sp.]|nr:cytidylate kinase family protein [Usitatibacter sp.]